jgi:phage gp36-like protein
MTYATTQDFIDNFGHEIVALTNLNNASAVALNVPVLQANQRKAYALINGMIARCPDVAKLMPFATPPELLVGYELDITRYYLDSIQAREDVRKRFEDAKAELAMIGKCQMLLGLIGNPEVVQESISVSVGVIETAGIFTGEVLHGY